MAESAQEATVCLGINEGVSHLVQRLVNPVAVVELVLRNCIVREPEALLAQIGRCVHLRCLRCASCALAPSQLFQVTMERLANLEELELSLVDTLARSVESEISKIRQRASRHAAIILYRSSLRRLYVEVGGDHNFKLLWELVGFYTKLTKLHVHVVRGGAFSKAVSEARRLHDSLVRLESFTFTSELPLQLPCRPDFTSTFSILLAACANLRHRRVDDLWSSLTLLAVANTDEICFFPPQLVVVALMNDEMERRFHAASRPHLWTYVRQLCLLLHPPMRDDPFYPAAGGASSQCLRNFFSAALDQVVELNLSSLHVHHDLDLMDLLPEKTLYRLEAFSAPPCAFRSQSAVRRLEASCPNLLNLDVRIQRLQGHFRCASCELLISDEWTMQPWSIPGAFYYRFKGIARLTLCDVSSEALLWFLECYGAAVVLRLANWRHFDILHFGRLCEHLGVNDSIRCLVIQHDNLPINDERLPGESS
ncbi:hypothetical protein MRX96_022149 [Rhipicephalus microplus]